MYLDSFNSLHLHQILIFLATGLQPPAALETASTPGTCLLPILGLKFPHLQGVLSYSVSSIVQHYLAFSAFLALLRILSITVDSAVPGSV